MIKDDFSAWVVPSVRTLKPYEPGKPIETLQRETGIEKPLKLASNENPLGPSPQVLSGLKAEQLSLARYPDGNGFFLKQALSEFYQLPEDCFTLGNGSNDILELLARVFAAPGREVIFSQYAFVVYPLATQAVGAQAVVIPAKEWGTDLLAMLAAINERTSLVFIANPNNPTGTCINAADLESFLQQVPQHVVVVLDEAYYEYAQVEMSRRGDSYPNSEKWLARFPNLVITRTFSKAYGLAGLRVGYSLSSPQVADFLNRIRQPFNVNAVALQAAVLALSDQNHVAQSVEINHQGLRFLEGCCQRLALNFIPSLGNFLTIDVGNEAMDVYQRLLQRGIIVRPLAPSGLPHHLRVSVGLPEENQKFENSLMQVLT